MGKAGILPIGYPPHTPHRPKKVDKIANHWYACTNKKYKGNERD